MLAGGAEKTTETHPAAGKPRHDPFGALPSPHQSVRLREELLRKHFLERAPLRGCTPYRGEEQDERLVQQINERRDQHCTADFWSRHTGAREQLLSWQVGRLILKGPSPP